MINQNFDFKNDIEIEGWESSPERNALSPYTAWTPSLLQNRPWGMVLDSLGTGTCDFFPFYWANSQAENPLWERGSDRNPI